MAGIHSAVDWLLRHDREGDVPRKRAWGQGAALAKIDRELATRARVARLAEAAGVAGLLASPGGRGPLLTGEPPFPEHGPGGRRRWYVNGEGHTLAVVPGPVDFLMGSPGHEPRREPMELLHRQRVPRTFAIATKPVTVAQFQKFLRAHKVGHEYVKARSPDPEGPIVAVTWYEAAQYCRWRSEREGVPESQMCYPRVAEIQKCQQRKAPLRLPAGYLTRTGYRLPTDAEWELACRAGARTSRHYGGAQDLLAAYSWHLDNAEERAWPVGQKKPNDFGLFDLHGNVIQWCQDHFQRNRFESILSGRLVVDEMDDGMVRDTSTCFMRGGSSSPAPRIVRAAYFEGRVPAYRNDVVGLRVARTCR